MKKLYVLIVTGFLFSCGMQGLNGFSPTQLSSQNNGTAKAFDREIESRVRNEIKSAGLERNNHIKVNSFYSILLISGEVKDAQQIKYMNYIARNFSGALKAYNYLEVMPESSFKERTADALISANIKKSLVASKDLSRKNIKAVVTRGVVYLVGVGSRRHVAGAINAARNVGGVRKIVNLIEIIY